MHSELQAHGMMLTVI